MRTHYTNFRWGLTGEPQEMLVEDGRVVHRSPSAVTNHTGEGAGGEGSGSIATEPGLVAEETFETLTPSPLSRDEPHGGGDIVDLNGRYLLPAFVDPHCHILPTGLDLQKLHLGGCEGHGDVLDRVRERHGAQPDGWLHAVHYDQTRYGGVHLTRHDLDGISGTRPILLRHVNGHASVANSAALRAAGVDDATPDPPGGSFRRGDDGKPDGVLFEAAHERVTSAAPNPTLEEMVQAILAAGGLMRGMGIACASDMMTGRFDLRRDRGVPHCRRNGMRDTNEAVPSVEDRRWPARRAEGGTADLVRGLEEDRCRVAGIKIFADGALGSATAAIYGRYSGEPGSAPAAFPSRPPLDGETSGQLIYLPEKLTEMVRTAHDAEYAVATHCIGDYATDLVMDAYEATGEPARHRIEHAMILSDAQIGRLARLGSPVCFQPEFLLRFGHAYLRQLGPERTAKLKRTRSLLDAGIPLCFGSDRPIVPGDPWDAIRTAEERPEIYDPAENSSRLEGLLAHTTWAATTNGDMGMGTLEEESLADFEVYEDDPLKAVSP